MSKKIPYIRVAVSYYKIVAYPTTNGLFTNTLVYWNIDTIRHDHGREYISNIPKHDGFVCIPSHIDFKKEFGSFYNTYSPLSCDPKEGSVSNTMYFLEHIFGDQIDIGLDYLQLIYTMPTQILPILCLVSQSRSTGKSTFLKWLKEIYVSNATFITNDSFASNFNSDWASKLLILIDEVLFNKSELTERIKFLSTTSVNKVEAKGKDRREVQFFGKFLLCSNNENGFIKIDADETRFWVIKIPKLASEDTQLLQKMTVEIPAFLYFLSYRELTTTNQTRMWFTPEQIKTKALVRLMCFNRSRIEQSMASLLISVMETFDMSELKVCPQDLVAALNRSRTKTDLTEIRRILKKSWRLEPQSNSNSYEKLHITSDGEFEFCDMKGRYFTITKDFLSDNFDELMTE